MAEEISAQQQDLIKRFKQYLHSRGAYGGDIKNPEPDAKFVSALKHVESIISKALQVYAAAPPNSANNLIWQNNQINLQTSPEDVEKAFTLLSKAAQIKKAQALVDSVDLKEPQPTAIKIVPMQDETKLEDYDNSQQIGLLQPKVPARMPQKDRIKALNELLSNSGNK